MQFKVPQNIDLEDKIIGPLTMIQFLYVLIGGMLDYVLLQTVFPKNVPLFLVLALPIAVFTLSMAFLKINDLPFPKFIQGAILFLVLPKRRVWHKNVDLSSPVRIEAPIKKAVPKIIKKQIEKSEIEKLASVLDTAGWAGVRDEHLKEFVKGFDAAHHTTVEPTPQKTKSLVG